MVQGALFEPRPAKVVDLSEYRRWRSARSNEVPEPGRTGESDKNESGWVPNQARRLSATEVAHRERMLKHLAGV